MLTPTIDSSDLKVPFGRRGDELFGPGDVAETGLACGCVCPGCGAKLLARQGSKRRHFAHYNAPGSILCVERAIHGAAIQVLLKANRLAVPALVVYAEKTADSGIAVLRSFEMHRQETIVFDACEDEVTFSSADTGTIRTDVVGYYGQKKLLIEIRFTHPVDAEKLAKVERNGHAMIEIDVSSLRFDGKLASLERCVLDDLENKQWLYYPGSASTVQRLTEQVDAEIGTLNEEYEKDLAKWRQADAARAAEVEQQRREKRRQSEEAEAEKQAAIMARVAAYRNKPIHEKEEAILLRLRVNGDWPEHLCVEDPDNRAFSAPFRLWQAALFHQFIFEKPLRQTIDSFEVAQWVKQWFGDASSGGYGCFNAVTAYLHYLTARGSLRYHDYRRAYPSFVVINNKLNPPIPSHEVSRLSSFVHVSHNSDHRDRGPAEVRWKENWPGYTQARSGITKRQDRPNADALTLLHVLFQCRQDLPPPEEFAEMIGHEVPSIQVLVFLKVLGFTEEVWGN